MPKLTSEPKFFILSVFDREQWCLVLQSMFAVPDVAVLRKILNIDADEDLAVRQYLLQPEEVAAIIAAFDVHFDPKGLACTEFDVILFSRKPASRVPYLVHGGFELPLLLSGQKKLARFQETYPPMTFKGEDRFDSFVTQGILHKKVVDEPYGTAIGDAMGLRTIYYTIKGEEWRAPAMEFVWQAAGKAGGWNEYFERLEGMLFGYEDWQNDWWIESGLRRGGFGGAPLCCAVTEDGLAWLESAGFRALPPSSKSALIIAVYDDDELEKMRAIMLQEADSVALVRFVVPLYKARALLPVSPNSDGRWLLASHRIPELNRHLRNAVVVAMRRDDQS